MLLNSKHPFLDLSADFSEICRPLQNLDIIHSTYLKQLKTGERIGLSTKPKWLSDYYNLGLYKSSLFEKAIENYFSSFNLLIGSDNVDLEVYCHSKDYYNFTHSISIVEPTIDGCEFFLFSTTPENIAAIYYLNEHREILYHFILYLKDKGKTLFKKGKQNAIELPCFEGWADSLTLENYFLKKDKTRMGALRRNFFKETPVHSYQLEGHNLSSAKLTARELNCIFLLVNHKTSKEIAREMNISHRTVEAYLENIKNKVDSHSKLDLLKKFSSDKLIKAFR